MTHAGRSTRIDVQYDGFAAVRGASVSIRGGRTLALVGESGSGKSSLALAAARLLPPGTDVAGSIKVGDRELSELTGRGAARRPRPHRRLPGAGRHGGAQPRDARRQAGGRGVRARTSRRRAGDAQQRAVDLLRRVGIQGPEIVARKYPHELSGGMRQRVMIAIALALAPEVLVADEPTTALDVTVQAEILALVRELQAERELVVVWITHDMGVVAEIADEVAVMYGGRIVEHAPVARGVRAARCTRTRRALIGSAREEPARRRRRRSWPSPASRRAASVPPGCPFHPRCPIARGALLDRCFRPSASWGWGIPSPVISLADVHKRYGPVRALDGVSLALEPGRHGRPRRRVGLAASRPPVG